MGLNVLVLSGIYPWIGNAQDAVFVRQQVRSLVRAGLGCRVVVFRYCPPGVPPALWRIRYASRLERRDNEEGFAVHDIFVSRRFGRGADVIPRVAASLAEHIERDASLRNTEVVYAHWLWPAGAVALELRRRFGWPVVAIARGSEMHHWQKASVTCRPYVQRVIREADRVLANCAAFREEARRLVPDLRKNIDVVYNGCDARLFAPTVDRQTARRSLGLKANARLMLFCGSVIERKGIRNLVHAWEKFCSHSSDWELVVTGRLVERSHVELLRRSPRTVVVGPVLHSEVIGYMQAADAYVQPSILEGLSNATMEAMAAGLPVIATDTGGQGELIRNGYNGLLIPVEDSDALLHAFVTVASSPARARRMGDAARKTIIDRYAPATQIAALTRVLTETVSRRRADAERNLDRRAVTEPRQQGGIEDGSNLWADERAIGAGSSSMPE